MSTRDNDLARSMQTGGNGYRSSNPLKWQMRAVDDTVTLISDWLDEQGAHSLADKVRRRDPWREEVERNPSTLGYRGACGRLGCVGGNICCRPECDQGI